VGYTVGFEIKSADPPLQRVLLVVDIKKIGSDFHHHLSITTSFLIYLDMYHCFSAPSLVGIFRGISSHYTSQYRFDVVRTGNDIASYTYHQSLTCDVLFS